MNSSTVKNSDVSGTDNNEIFNFKCKYCFKNLSSRQNLREHTYIHTGERPFICTEVGCGQRFRQGSLLSIHKKIHLEICKSKKYEKNSNKKSQYPKLTDMICNSYNALHFSFDEIEKNAWISKIGEQNFGFVIKYL